MSTLAEVLAGQVVRAQVVNVGTATGFLRSESAEHLAAVVAEWLESEQSVEVVAEAIFDSTDPHQRKRYEEGNAVSGYDDEYARSALDALAAHAKGEAS